MANTTEAASQALSFHILHILVCFRKDLQPQTYSLMPFQFQPFLASLHEKTLQLYSSYFKESHFSLNIHGCNRFFTSYVSQPRVKIIKSGKLVLFSHSILFVAIGAKVFFMNLCRFCTTTGGNLASCLFGLNSKLQNWRRFFFFLATSHFAQQSTSTL